VDTSDGDYASLVSKLKDHIRAGDVFQIVPSRTFSTPCADPVEAYRKLREQNPSPYMFFVRSGNFTLFGASPEACVKVSGNPRTVEIHPIAGTKPRGRLASGEIDRDLDDRLEAELRLNEKELAEHMMLVDMARNDVARISRAGTRRVKSLCALEKYSRVMHLVSMVEGELKDDFDALHAYIASMNMGTVVGAPKIEAARLLRKYEKTRRGPYAGAVGYLTSEGEMDSAIIIRTALVKDGVAKVRAGAGIVYDSDPHAEAEETRNKADAVLRAIRSSQGGER
jgi:anthranilate synthase component 1